MKFHHVVIFPKLVKLYKMVVIKVILHDGQFFPPESAQSKKKVRKKNVFIRDKGRRKKIDFQSDIALSFILPLLIMLSQPKILFPLIFFLFVLLCLFAFFFVYFMMNLFY